MSPGNHRWFFSILFLLCGQVCAQSGLKPALESFESDQVLRWYATSGGNLSLSYQHRKFGQKSLAWEWYQPASFGTANFRLLGREESPLKYGRHFPASPSLSMSVYNETPQAGMVRIAYESGGKQQVWFDIPLDFQGWRQIWVPFYEMQGNAPKKGAAVSYDYFRVSTAAAQGKLFFDDIIFSQYQDDRHSYPDRMVPFIKAKQAPDQDHWMPLLRHLDWLDHLQTSPVTDAVRTELQTIESQIDHELRLGDKGKDCLSSARNQMIRLKLEAHGANVLGPPLSFQLEQDYFDPAQQGDKVFNDIRDLGLTLKTIALCRDQASPAAQAELDKMLITGARYFLDQGWQAGSSGGTRHHIGYKVRELTEAFYLMRHTLDKAALLADIGRSLQWLYNLGMVLGDDKDFYVNIDYLNTQSYFHLMLIFMSDSRERQAALLSAYSHYLSVTLAQQNEEWGFKTDGTAWHHNGHYPAYGMGAFKTVPKVIRTLSETRFRISKDGHTNFRKAFLATRAYSHLYDFGFGNAGRHPFDELNNINSLKTQYLDMALAGNPDGTPGTDRELAAAYLRLWGSSDILSGRLAGLRAEQLSGYITMPYAATAIHRRNDWAAIVKGYSKYVWSSEIYLDENRYGRYPANGTIQLLNRKGERGSGFRQDGWDWNRYPGGTIIYLPLAELEPDVPLLMFRSDETFAGAVQSGGDGVFGMVLNEAKGSNADGQSAKTGFSGKLKAKKSVFSFGDKLICIGTNISSADKKNATQTTLFQSALINRNDPLPSSLKLITGFPFYGELPADTSSAKWLLDPYGNGYHMLSAGAVQIKKDMQHSYRNTYSVRTGKNNPGSKGVKNTEGDFASAWIDHGFAPADASYQYVIYPEVSSEQLEHFATRTKQEQSYDILRADGVAHIVLDRQTSAMGYVVFEADQPLGSGIVKSVSAPALLIVRHDAEGVLTISVVQPDLNFPENQQGKFSNYSRPVSLKLTLQSKWRAFEPYPAIQLQDAGDNTIITIECKDGLTTEFKLTSH